MHKTALRLMISMSLIAITLLSTTTFGQETAVVSPNKILNKTLSEIISGGLDPHYAIINNDYVAVQTKNWTSVVDRSATSLQVITTQPQTAVLRGHKEGPRSLTEAEIVLNVNYSFKAISRSVGGRPEDIFGFG